MNTDNTNLENGMGSETLGAAPVQPEPINPQSDETFTPFQDLNDAALNVPTEGVNAAPVNDFAQPAPSVEEPSFNVAPTPDVVPDAPVQPEIPATPDALNPEVDSININNPVQDAPINPEPVFATEQAAPTIAEDIAQPAPSVEAPVLDAEPVLEAAPVMDVQPEVASVQEPSVDNQTVETPQQGPTLPIPDQMPTNDYQATVSTPVDYATPMSDFDQIGTTPELDPKAKGDKKKNKSLTLLLIILLVAALGGGAYYLINVKGILNGSSVIPKEVTAEKGEALSTVIDDYATFKGVSASNCVLDVTKVNISEAGTYEFTITCGDKKVTGNVVVKDSKGPEVTPKLAIISAGSSITADGLVSSSTEEATYKFTDESAAKQQFATSGLKNIDVTATDTSGNESTHKLPLIVTSAEFKFAIIAKKNVSGDDTKADIIEKNVILYNDSAGIVNDTGYTAYIIAFKDKSGYTDATSNYDGSGSLTYSSYTGLPLFYKENNTLVILKDINSSLIQATYNDTFMNLRDSLGYQVSSGQSTNLEPLNYTV